MKEVWPLEENKYIFYFMVKHCHKLMQLPYTVHKLHLKGCLDYGIQSAWLLATTSQNDELVSNLIPCEQGAFRTHSNNNTNQEG